LPNFRSNSGGSDSQQPRVERERKNCVFVKNIPKHYNEVDKLMTFFKNEGAIKEIRVNHE
jgi:RNA recognition motif-containing protein